jgi:glycosyltransferase involved in cell wall biosynthesis
VAAFTAKMVRLVTDHQLRKKMGEKAARTALDYDINRTSQLLLEHYQRLVSNKASYKLSLRNKLASLFQKQKI